MIEFERGIMERFSHSQALYKNYITTGAQEHIVKSVVSDYILFLFILSWFAGHIHSLSAIACFTLTLLLTLLPQMPSTTAVTEQLY